MCPPLSKRLNLIVEGVGLTSGTVWMALAVAAQGQALLWPTAVGQGC